MTTTEDRPLESMVGLDKLREAFPAGTVGILPKPYRKDSPKGKCDVCGGFHGLPAAHLDFVGHAAVTDRLLSADLGWTWEPMHRQIDPQVLAAALTSGNPECVRLVIENSPPALDKDGNLWIRLTVCGVTRPGVGDGFSMKERIGDAIRNASMRYGVALSLWTKDELESGHTETKAVDAEKPVTNRRARGTVRRAPNAVAADPETGEIVDAEVVEHVTAEQSSFLSSMFEQIEDHATVVKLKQAFTLEFGRPADVAPDRYDAAVDWIGAELDKLAGPIEGVPLPDDERPL